MLVRKPWATALLDAIAHDRDAGYLAGHAAAIVHYIVERERNRATTAPAVSDLLQLLVVVLG